MIDVVIMIDVMRAALCSALAPPCCSDYHLLGGMAAARGDSLVKQKYLGAAPPASLLPPLEIHGGLRPPASVLPTYWGAAPPASQSVGQSCGRSVGWSGGRSGGRGEVIATISPAGAYLALPSAADSGDGILIKKVPIAAKKEKDGIALTTSVVFLCSMAGTSDTWLTGWLVGWLAGWLVGILKVTLVDWLAGWLAGWHSACRMRISNINPHLQFWHNPSVFDHQIVQKSIQPRVARFLSGEVGGIGVSL